MTILMSLHAAAGASFAIAGTAPRAVGADMGRRS